MPPPRVVADAIAGHITAFPPAGDGSLFTTRTGAVYRHDYYGAPSSPQPLRAVDHPAEPPPPDPRHHYASVLLAVGESVVAVAERLGH